MSRASKIFLGSSIFASAFTVWGVHFLQERESTTMYQGVLRDEARLRDKALSAAKSAASSLVSPLTQASGSSNTPLNTPSSPARAPGVPVPPPSAVGAKQPAAVIDEDCETCRISPPAELLESQSREVRRAEREAREAEYRQQKDLAGRLQKEQGVHVGDHGGVGGGRMV